MIEVLKQARQILWRYRHEMPISNQPHMIAHEADENIERIDQALAQPVQEREVLKQALEVLDIETPTGSYIDVKNALRTAIAQPAAQRKPLTLGQKQRLWSSVGDKPTLKDRVNAYGLAIEAAHGIGENT